MKFLTIYGLPGTGKSTTLKLLSHLDFNHVQQWGHDTPLYKSVKPYLTSNFAFRTYLQARALSQILFFAKQQRSSNYVLDFLCDPEISNHFDACQHIPISSSTCSKLYIRAPYNVAYNRWSQRSSRADLSLEDFKVMSERFDKLAHDSHHDIIEHPEHQTQDQLKLKLEHYLRGYFR